MTLVERALGRGQAREDRRTSRRRRRRRRVVVNPRPSPGSRRGRKLKRNDIAMRLEKGRSFRVPSIPLPRLRSRLPTLLLLGVCVWAVLQIWRLPMFRVDHVAVSGVRYVSPSRIRSMADVKGSSIFSVDPSSVVAKLESYPEIASAQVKATWPNQVEITVQERKPVLRWIDSGYAWMVSEDGLAFYSGVSDAEVIEIHSEVQVLEIGDPLEKVVEPTVVNAILELSSLLESDQPLLFNPKHGIGFLDERGWKAYFGTEGDMSKKYQVYLQIVEHLDREFYPARLVSVEDLGAPFFY